jgi:hypothetical protein
MPNRRAFLLGSIASGSLLTSLESMELHADEPKQSNLTGKVVSLFDALESLKVKSDKENDSVCVLLTKEGNIYPIIRDASGRRFYKDPQLLKKEYRITGNLLGGSVLQVLSLVGIKDGKTYDVYYWCDICSIRRNELMICECCGGNMEMREVLIEK